MPEPRADALGLDFTVELDLVVEVANDARQTDALITVRASRGEGPAAAEAFAEILIMDRSLSMASHGKLTEAKRAACAAIDALGDGVYLGIIAGNQGSEIIFPAGGGLARVDAEVKAAAKQRVRGLVADGGTAIGQWLTHAAELFEEAAPAGAVCHAALYTDGRNQLQSPQDLELSLARCADRFVCHPRGLGEDWDYVTLLRIAEALHGEARAVVEISDLAADFARLTRDAQRLLVPRVYLGLLRLGPLFRVGRIRQVSPVEAELTHQRPGEGRDVHVPLGAWSAGSRQYRLSLTFDAETLPVEEELQAARVTLLAEAADGTRRECVVGVPLPVRRSEFGAPLPAPSREFTNVERFHELGETIRACADAWLAREFAEAGRELGRAIQLAEALGDTVRLRLLNAIADVEDGRTIVRRDATRGQIQELGVWSRAPGVMSDKAVNDLEEPVEVHVCPACGEETQGQDALACESCGRRFVDEAP